MGSRAMYRSGQSKELKAIGSKATVWKRKDSVKNCISLGRKLRYGQVSTV